MLDSTVQHHGRDTCRRGEPHSLVDTLLRPDASNRPDLQLLLAGCVCLLETLHAADFSDHLAELVDVAVKLLQLGRRCDLEGEALEDFLEQIAALSDDLPHRLQYVAVQRSVAKVRDAAVVSLSPPFATLVFLGMALKALSVGKRAE